MLSNDVEVGIARLQTWRNNPCAFVEDNWPEVELDAWQREALEYSSTPGVKRLCMLSSAGTGKSAVLSWLGLQRLSCYASPTSLPKGFCVAVDRENLKLNLWAELGKWHDKSPFLKRQFGKTADRIFAYEDESDSWFLAARGFAKKATGEEQAASLSGLHSDYAFVLIDESATIDMAVADRAEQAMSTAVDGLIATAGNPLSRTGMLYECGIRRRDTWYVIEITSDPDSPRRCSRVGKEWAQQQIDTRDLGREDPWVKVYILGQFPEHALMTLLTREQVEEAMERNPKEEDYKYEGKAMGIDVARQGLDASVIFPRQGRLVLPPIVMRGLDGLQGAAATARKWTEWNADAAFIDNSGGFGASWIDQLHVLGYSPVPVEFAGKPQDKRFFNKRAEMYWRCAEWVKSGGALPYDRELIAELSEPTYTFKGDRILIEDKDQIRSRLKGRSPDKADALALTFAYDVAPKRDLMAQDGLYHHMFEQKIQLAKMEQEPEW
jgi:phage terminase large subunit